VPFLREGVAVQHHWLTEHQSLDAVAMGLITPISFARSRRTVYAVPI
jgi:hypothetical protein